MAARRSYCLTPNGANTNGPVQGYPWRPVPLRMGRSTALRGLVFTCTCAFLRVSGNP